MEQNKDTFLKYYGSQTERRLDNNQLKELPPGVFDQNKDLYELKLNDNHLKFLPEGIFDFNPGLYVLNLNDNQLEILTEDVFRKNTLLGKPIRWERMSDDFKARYQKSDMPPEYFDDKADLWGLFLSNNKLKNLPERIFHNNQDLTILWLESNGLQELPPGIFDNNKELHSLRLNNNNLTALSRGLFRRLKELEELWLNNNNITSLHPKLFANLKKLDELDLSTNNVRRLPKGIFDSLTNLTFLFLAHNKLDNLSPSIFRNLTKLRILKLEKNKITKLHRDQFKGLAELYDLYLQSNSIEVLTEGIFDGLKNLLSVDLSLNDIRNVSKRTFKDITSLHILFMHYNLMYDLPEGFFKEMKNISRISFDSNIMCCHAEFKQDADCVYVINDNFANCDSMFRDPNAKRGVWIIGIISLIGAVLVLVWRTYYKEKNIAQSIMLMHVAVADGLMGVYLLVVGIMDAVWSGVYYLHDFQWRTGLPCQIVGGIAMLSSEVSIMILSLLSLDRVKHIVYPKRFKMLTRKKTHAFCFVIWVVGFFIAFLPTFGIRYFYDPEAGIYFYGKSVVCMPIQLTPEFISGWEYSAAVFVALNVVFVLFIVIAYAMIFAKTFLSKRRLRLQGTRREREARKQTADAKTETSLAKRIAGIVLTDVACWAPIIGYGMRSAVDKAFSPRGDIAVVLAVFVLPINSAINPFLYTFSTSKAQDILFKKVRSVWNYIRGIPTCCDDDEEEAGESEENEDDEERNGYEDDEDQEMIGMQVFSFRPGKQADRILLDLEQMRNDASNIINGRNLLEELEKTVSDKGFEIDDNEGSGNCMFLALSEQLDFVKGIQMPHEALRRRLVEYLRENPTLLDGTELFNFVDGYRSWNDYLQAMAADGTWGDHVILHAAASCFETSIHVISSLSNDVTINPEYDVGSSSQLVLGHVHEHHFVSLRPKSGNGVKRLEEQDGKSDQEQDAGEEEKSVPRNEADKAEIRDKVKDTESKTVPTETELLEEHAGILDEESERMQADAVVLEAEEEVPEADAEVLQAEAVVLEADAEALVEEAEVLEAKAEAPETDTVVLQAEAVVRKGDAEALVEEAVVLEAGPEALVEDVDVLVTEGEVLMDEPDVLEVEAVEKMKLATSEVTKPATKAEVVGSENPEVSDGGSVREDPGVASADTVSVGTAAHGDRKVGADVEPRGKVGDAEAKLVVAEDLSEDEAEVVEEADLQMVSEPKRGVDKAGEHQLTMKAADTELLEPITADVVVKEPDTTVTEVADAREAEGMQSAAVKDLEGGYSQSSKSADNKMAMSAAAEAVNQCQKREEADAKQPKSAGDSKSAAETGTELEEGTGGEMVEVTRDPEVARSADSEGQQTLKLHDQRIL